MAETYEFRTAKLTLDGDNVPFTVEASFEEKWDVLTYPVYLDQPLVATVPTLKRAIAVIRRMYQPDSPLHAALNESGITLEFETAGDTFTYTTARVLEWKISGKVGGEMTEEVTLSCEE